MHYDGGGPSSRPNYPSPRLSLAARSFLVRGVEGAFELGSFQAFSRTAGLFRFAAAIKGWLTPPPHLSLPLSPWRCATRPRNAFFFNLRPRQLLLFFYSGSPGFSVFLSSWSLLLIAGLLYSSSIPCSLTSLSFFPSRPFLSFSVPWLMYSLPASILISLWPHFLRSVFSLCLSYSSVISGFAALSGCWIARTAKYLRGPLEFRDFENLEKLSNNGEFINANQTLKRGNF